MKRLLLILFSLPALVAATADPAPIFIAITISVNGKTTTAILSDDAGQAWAQATTSAGGTDAGMYIANIFKDATASTLQRFPGPVLAAAKAETAQGKAKEVAAVQSAVEIR